MTDQPTSRRARAGRSRLGWALALAALAPAAPIARADVVTLEAIEARALASHASLDAQAARARAAHAHVDALRAEGLPSLSLDVGASASPSALVEVTDTDPDDRDDDGDDLPNEPEDMDGALSDTNHNGWITRTRVVPGNATASSGARAFVPAARLAASLRLEGVLYDFGRTDARVRAGQASAAAEELDVQAQRETIVRGVRAAYLNWLGADARRRFTEAGLEGAASRAQGLEGALEAGARAASDRDAALLEVARVRLELARAEGLEADARLLIEQASGVALDGGAEPDRALLDLEPPDGPRPEPAIARALELRRDGARAAAQLYDLRHVPVLTGAAEAGIGLQIADGVSPLVLPNYQLQLGLSVPLWEPRTDAHVRLEADAQADAFDAAASEARTTADVAHRRARERYARARDEVELAGEVVRLAERAAAGSEERWRIAGGSLDHVLAAHERVSRAREELVRAQLERLEAALHLSPID